MTKGFRYWFRCITVATLTGLLTFNPVWAGRGLRSLFSKRQACSPTVCCLPAAASVDNCCPSQPTDCCEVAVVECPAAIDDSSCCGSDSQVGESTLVPEMHLPAPANDAAAPEASAEAPSQAIVPPSASAAAPTQPAPQPEFDSVLDSTRSPSDAAPPVAPVEQSEAAPVEAAPVEAAPTPPSENNIDTTETEQPAAPATNDNPFGNATESPANEPDVTEPAPSEPALPNDLFGTPSEPTEDLFSTPPAEAPPAEAAPELTSPATDDLFGTPSAEAAPAQPAIDDLFGAPAQPSDDLFSTPPAEATPPEPAADELFGTPATPTEDLFGAPSSEAPTTEPGVDDLFGTPATPADDLFGTPPSDAAPELPSGDDIFGAPPAEEATPAKPATDSVDDLFGVPSAALNTDEDAFGTPASTLSSELSDELLGQAKPTAASSEASPYAELNDLFGTPTVTEEEAAAETAEAAEETAAQPVAVETESAPSVDAFKSTRTWHDNTGMFQVDAQLVAIFTDQVRLLKENGKYCTLPLRRLSDTDKQFVEHVSSLLPGDDVKYVSTPK